MKKSKGLRKRKSPTPEQLKKREQKAHIKNYRTLFQKLGFVHIPTDGTEFNYQGRTGELDDIFIFENIILLVEYTIGKSDTSHLARKKILYDLILQDTEAFLNFAIEKFAKFQPAMNQLFPQSTYKIRILYASKNDPSSELEDTCPDIHFIYGARAKYFQLLVKTIERSARIEFLKFLELQHDEVGEAAISSNHSPIVYNGFLLPDGNSSYPSDYKIVSFYADPERLMDRCYVLRRDGWRDESHLYQRILIQEKIKQMRKYLTEEKRVFINNVIVTLPSETTLNEIESTGRNIPRNDLGRVRPVEIQIPDGFDMIGLVDGQHRVFCYHEGSDRAEAEIKILRKRQNLMITGIVYPVNVSVQDKRSFEARLFLEINDNQARARSSLKQDIELIIRPYSGIAIAKRVVQELGKRGPYKGMLQNSYFDSPNKIKTSSIVSYGLRPLVKLDGIDSLFSAWNNPRKNELKDAKGNDRLDLLEEYISFCTLKINEFFIEAKLAFQNGDWDIDAKPRSPLLSPTAINGLIVCLRRIIENKHALTMDAHKSSLVGLDKIEFSSFKSSQWQRLGGEIYTKHFAGAADPGP